MAERISAKPRSRSVVDNDLPARLPGLIGVAVGAFADPAFAAPEQAVFVRDKHHWFELPREMVVFECNPPPPAASTAVEPSPAS